MNILDAAYHMQNVRIGISLFESVDRLNAEKKALAYLNKPEDIPLKKVKPCGYLDPKIWKPLRLKVILLYGKGCMKCKLTPEDKDVHVDHIKPKSKYPELKYEITNLQVLCKKCNFEKGYLSETSYLDKG